MRKDDVDRLIELRKVLAEEALDTMVAENQRLGLYDDKVINNVQSVTPEVTPDVDAVTMSEECVHKSDKPVHEWLNLTPQEFNEIKDTSTTIGYAITRTEAKLREKNT